MQRVNGHPVLWGGKPERLETMALGRLGGKSQYAVPGRGRTVRPLSYESWAVG